MKLRALAAFAVLALSTACSSSAEPVDTDEGAIAEGRTLAGGFRVRLDGHDVKFDYTLSAIDLSARTVLWNAKVTDDGGHDAVWDDEDVRGKITSVARCPGCFVAEVPGSNAHPLAIVSVSDWRVVSIKYEDVEARLSSAGGGDAQAQNGAASPDDVGACTQTCSGRSSCKPNVQRSQCASGTGLFPVMRCPTTYTFAEGEPCRP